MAGRERPPNLLDLLSGAARVLRTGEEIIQAGNEVLGGMEDIRSSTARTISEGPPEAPSDIPAPLQAAVSVSRLGRKVAEGALPGTARILTGVETLKGVGKPRK